MKGIHLILLAQTLQKNYLVGFLIAFCILAILLFYKIFKELNNKYRINSIFYGTIYFITYLIICGSSSTIYENFGVFFRCIFICSGVFFCLQHNYLNKAILIYNIIPGLLLTVIVIFFVWSQVQFPVEAINNFKNAGILDVNTMLDLFRWCSNNLLYIEFIDFIFESFSILDFFTLIVFFLENIILCCVISHCITHFLFK